MLWAEAVPADRGVDRTWAALRQAQGPFLQCFPLRPSQGPPSPAHDGEPPRPASGGGILLPPPPTQQAARQAEVPPEVSRERANPGAVGALHSSRDVGEGVQKLRRGGP